MAISYVGGRGAGRAGSTSTVNVAINSGLTGGSGSAALAGDLVIVTVAVATQGRNPTCAVSGYTPLSQQHTTATTYDISVCTSYKFMPGTPDTQVTIPSTGNIADGQGYRIMVFRGVDPTVPLDGVTPTYLTGSGANNRPDPQAITPFTTGAWIYFGGGGAASTGTTVFTASYLSGFASYNGPDTNDGTVGAGYYSGWSSGAYNGAVWAGGSVNAANSWGCTSLVLRPAATNYSLTATGITASPVVANPATTQNHVFTATGITSTPVVGIPVLTRNVVFEATGITASPGLGAPVLTQQVSYSLSADGIAAGAAALGVPGVGQNHVFVANLISLAPGVGTPSIGQAHVLMGDGIGSIPIVGAPAVGQNHGFVVEELATLPVVGQPAIGQNQVLEGEGVAGGAPVLGTPTIGGADDHLAANGITAGPAVGSPTVGQIHAFMATGILGGAVVGGPSLTQLHVLQALGIGIIPVVGTPAASVPVPKPSRVARLARARIARPRGLRDRGQARSRI